MAGSDYGVICFKNGNRINDASIFKIKNELYYFYKFNIYKIDEDNDLYDDLDYEQSINLLKIFNSEYRHNKFKDNDGYYITDVWSKYDLTDFFGTYSVVYRKSSQIFKIYIKDDFDYYHILIGYDVDDSYWYNKESKKICTKFLKNK